MLVNEHVQRLRQLTADALDDIGLAAEDAVLVIDSHRREVRHHRVGHAVNSGEHLGPGFDRKVDVLDRFAELLRNHARHFCEREVARSREDVSLTDVVRGIGEDP